MCLSYQALIVVAVTDDDHDHNASMDGTIIDDDDDNDAILNNENVKDSYLLNKHCDPIIQHQQKKQVSGVVKPILSVGKPSLRQRLLDYYSLVAPDVIYQNQNAATKTTIAVSVNDDNSSNNNSTSYNNTNTSHWSLHHFELIRNKYCGTIEVEQSLAR